jgi:hypothetical protein
MFSPAKCYQQVHLQAWVISRGHTAAIMMMLTNSSCCCCFRWLPEEEEVEVEDDLEPKYVNGKRVLVNREIE